MKTGKIKFFIEEKGYGFITEDGTGLQVFVHVSALGSLILHQGDTVSYDSQETPKGLNALNVKKIE